jgi:hypothetical protein
MFRRGTWLFRLSGNTAVSNLDLRPRDDPAWRLCLFLAVSSSIRALSRMRSSCQMMYSSLPGIISSRGVYRFSAEGAAVPTPNASASKPRTCVFLSYSRKDAAFADRLASALERCRQNKRGQPRALTNFLCVTQLDPASLSTKSLIDRQLGIVCRQHHSSTPRCCRRRGFNGLAGLPSTCCDGGSRARAMLIRHASSDAAMVPSLHSVLVSRRRPPPASVWQRAVAQALRLAAGAGFAVLRVRTPCSCAPAR